MLFHLDKCRRLYNARIKAQNAIDKKPLHEGKITQQALGHKFYPDNKDYYDIAGRVTKLKDNKAIYLKREWIKIVCEMFGVDPNFAFGAPSPVFDEEYEKYFPTNKKTS